MNIKKMRVAGLSSLCLALLLSGCAGGKIELSETLTNKTTNAEVACSFPERPAAIKKHAFGSKRVPLKNNSSLEKNNRLAEAEVQYLRVKANAGVRYGNAVEKFKKRCVIKRKG